MDCPRCKTGNRPGRKFCAACGQALSGACEQCGYIADSTALSHQLGAEAMHGVLEPERVRAELAKLPAAHW
jgi:hypothetical protein